MIAIIAPGRNMEAFAAHLTRCLPETAVRCWPDIGDGAGVTWAVVWQPPAGIWSQFPNLAVVQSYGAGVEQLLADSDLPDVPLCRMVEPALRAAMTRYLTGVVLADQLNLDVLAAHQRDHHWQPVAARPERNVLFLGAGEMARDAGRILTELGFKVTFWRRSPTADSHHLTGLTALTDAVATCDYLINTLPLTPETLGILDGTLWRHARGVYVVNVARGAHVNDDDLLAAIAAGQVRGATLDVFAEEPLAVDHPFWQMPQLRITPHCAALTDPVGAAAVVAESYRQWRMTGIPLHQVDRARGY